MIHWAMMLDKKALINQGPEVTGFQFFRKKSPSSYYFSKLFCVDDENWRNGQCQGSPEFPPMVGTFL